MDWWLYSVNRWVRLLVLLMLLLIISICFFDLLVFVSFVCVFWFVFCFERFLIVGSSILNVLFWFMFLLCVFICFLCSIIKFFINDRFIFSLFCIRFDNDLFCVNNLNIVFKFFGEIFILVLAIWINNWFFCKFVVNVMVLLIGVNLVAFCNRLVIIWERCIGLFLI